MSESKNAWRKSSYSDGTGNCVEVAGVNGLVAIRDTKQGSRGPLLEFTKATWRLFVAITKSNQTSSPLSPPASDAYTSGDRPARQLLLNLGGSA